MFTNINIKVSIGNFRKNNVNFMMANSMLVVMKAKSYGSVFTVKISNCLDLRFSMKD